MCERSGEAACEEPGSKQLTRRSKVAVAAQLSLCLWSTIFSVESQLKTEMKFLLYLVAAWEREKMHCVGELKNFCWGVLLEADRISAFFGFYFHWLLLFFLFFFLFSFFAFWIFRSCLHFFFLLFKTCLQLYVVSRHSAAVERDTLGAFLHCIPRYLRWDTSNTLITSAAKVHYLVNLHQD